MIVWREKLVAFGVHFVVTAILAAIAAALIFLVWYPDPFQSMIGGTELFMLVVGCDLALGPLMSLVIYNGRKSRRELFVDYTVVGIVQLAALVYGVYIVAGSRPVHVAFSSDRLEVVSALEVRSEELAAAKDPWRTLSWTGPRYAAVNVPPAEREDAMFQSLAGNEEHQRPKFFMPYDDARERILAKSKRLEDLEKKLPESRGPLAAGVADTGIPAARLRWLPVHYARGFWTALIDSETARPVGYVDFDPYGQD